MRHHQPISLKTGLTVALVFLLGLTSCKGSSVLGGVNLGPTVRAELTIVSPSTADGRNTEIAYIIDDLKNIEVELTELDNGNKLITRASHDFERENENTDDNGTMKKATWTWSVVRPDIAKVKGLITPRVTLNKIVNVLREDGTKTQLDIGGWYLVKKGSGIGI